MDEIVVCALEESETVLGGLLTARVERSPRSMAGPRSAVAAAKLAGVVHTHPFERL
ncbi:MAG: hypothetical protein ACM30G_23125 [Micromonosporaceae bacterium]